MIILNVYACSGPTKLLGIEFDNRLLMYIAMHTCAKTTAWKTKSLLRARRFYNTVDMLMLYTSHVLSCMDCKPGGIHFVAASVLRELDDVQTFDSFDN